AVGQYRLSVSAKPLEVSVGDPITLNIAISGTGRVETLQPPPLSQMSELTKTFKVPSDPVGGTVDGQTKRFSPSIRAVSDTVTQIPAIPFAYFDPRTERFVTVQS